MLGSTAALLGAAPFPRPALAQTSPILIGWLAALTGPSSAPAIGFDRGVRFAVDEINAAGGVKGRKIELVTRDTQGDPTKAVNAAQDMISRQKVHAIWGPTNSGEALATTPIMARAKMPNMHPCVVDSLIDPAKYPNAFRIAPSNSQWDDAVRRLLPQRPEGEGCRGGRRHHRLRRHGGGRLGRRASRKTAPMSSTRPRSTRRNPTSRPTCCG